MAKNEAVLVEWLIYIPTSTNYKLL